MTVALLFLCPDAVGAILSQKAQKFGNALMVWRRSAIEDGKPCLTAGKPQSGAACGKSATINMCLEVAQHCSTSSAPIYCVGFLLRRFRGATAAVKHSEAPSALFSQYMLLSLIISDINRGEVADSANKHYLILENTFPHHANVN